MSKTWGIVRSGAGAGSDKVDCQLTLSLYAPRDKGNLAYASTLLADAPP